MKWTAVVLTFCLTGQAVACPTAADREGPFSLIRLEPRFEVTATRIPNGFEEVQRYESDGTPQEITNQYAHPLAVLRRIGPNGVLSIAYGDNTEALAEIDQIGRWQTNIVLSRGGRLIGQGLFEAVFQGIETIEIGGCLFQAWAVDISLLLEGRDPVRNRHFYSPELDLPIGNIRFDADGVPVSGVFFDTITLQ